jgi:hypothetical protein
MNGDERLMRMAEELVYGREALAEALHHLVEYAGMLDMKSPLEAYIFGRTMAQIETLKRIYEDLDPMKGVDE